MRISDVSVEIEAIRENVRANSGNLRVEALTRSVETICDILDALCRESTPRPSGHAAPTIEVIGQIGETKKSPMDFWFRVTRINYDGAPRVRLELMRAERVLRSMDSTDHAFRELANILSKL